MGAAGAGGKVAQPGASCTPSAPVSPAPKFRGGAWDEQSLPGVAQPCEPGLCEWPSLGMRGCGAHTAVRGAQSTWAFGAAWLWRLSDYPLLRVHGRGESGRGSMGPPCLPLPVALGLTTQPRWGARSCSVPPGACAPRAAPMSPVPGGVTRRGCSACHPGRAPARRPPGRWSAAGLKVPAR